MNDSNNNNGIVTTFLGFLVGFATGAITAMLLTTKTGEELRSDIKKIATDIRDQVEDKAGKAKNLTKNKYEEIQNNVIANYKKIKQLTEKEVQFIKRLIAEQKEAAK
ncbi:MAG: YtxH domain-containing protein [Actinomycetota bacterium]|nr:YtxH domain-containing protein [Actinomycetota bacterium]